MIDTSALTQEAEREKMRVVTNRYGQKAALLSDVLQQEAAVTQADADYQKALAAFWSAKAISMPRRFFSLAFWHV